MTWNIAILITIHNLDVFTCAGRSEGQVRDLGRTNERAEAMRGYEPGHHGAQCRPEVSVPLTAKDHGPEKRKSRDRASTRLPLLPGGCPGSSLLTRRPLRVCAVLG